jgi:hypothetical protein
MLNFDELEFLPPTGPTIITLEVSPEEVELALATNGNLLHAQLMMALIAAMTTDTADPLARFLPWHIPAP